MEFVDRILRCMDCGEDFIFTAGEQLFFYDKQFKNDPKRCKPCKAKRAASQGRAPNGKGVPVARTETRTTCSSCGIETTVPFRPTQGRPVLCRSCFQQKPADLPITATVAAAVPTEAVAELTAAVELGKMEAEPIVDAAVVTATPDPLAN